MSTYSNLLQPALKNLYNVLFGSSTRDRHAYISGRSENNMKCIVHDDLGWKSQTNNSIYSAASLALRVIFSVSWLWNLFGSFTEPFICITSLIIPEYRSWHIILQCHGEWDSKDIADTFCHCRHSNSSIMV